MDKTQVIWSRTAIKKLYAIFESDIRKGNGKSFSIKFFKDISKQIKILIKQPYLGVRTSDDSVLGLIIDSYIMFYEVSGNQLVIHTISVLPLKDNK